MISKVEPWCIDVFSSPGQNQELCITTVVNFINFLRASFLYKILARRGGLLRIWELRTTSHTRFWPGYVFIVTL